MNTEHKQVCMLFFGKKYFYYLLLITIIIYCLPVYVFEIILRLVIYPSPSIAKH